MRRRGAVVAAVLLVVAGLVYALRQPAGPPEDVVEVSGTVEAT